MRNKLRKMLELHEGRVPHAYQDSRGYWTIGVGHLIDEHKGGKLPNEVIDLLLDYDIAEATKALPEWVWELDEVRQAVLIDMAFNLGPEPFDGDGFKDWPMFLRQVREGAYGSAAANMRSTLWATQVKRRAERLATMMQTGEWPDELA